MFANFSFFPARERNNQSKSLREYLFDTFNWLYEHSPINFSTITGMYHPSIQRLTGNPFLGRALEVTKDADGLANEIHRLAKIAEHDPKGRAYLSFGPHPTMLITRPEDIAQVFMHNNDNIDRGKLLDVFAKIFGDDNLFTMPTNDMWKEKRHKLTEWILQDGSLKELLPAMQAIVDEFITKMAENDGQIASLETFMVNLTMDVFAQLGLAAKPLGDKTKIISDGFGEGLEVASEPMNTVWLRLDALLKYIRVSASKHLDQQCTALQSILKENFYAENLDNLVNEPNVLQTYFQQAKNTDEAIANTIGDIGLLLLAGHETTSRLLQFAIILLAKHPEILKKVRDEVAEHRPQNGEWTYADIEKLTYLGKVLKETLRLYPPIPIIPRMVMKPFVLADIPVCTTQEEYEKAMQERDQTKDVILHPGTGIDIAPWITHRLASLYKDPDRFNPDRFDNAEISSTHHFKWFPFGVGERNCPGRKFAFLEAKNVLFKFLLKYNFTPSAKDANLLDVTMRGTLKHKGEIQLAVTPRRENENISAVRLGL